MSQGEPQVGDRLGRYRLVEVLGRGGMGTVFRARDEQLERDVAVKVILPALAAEGEFRERFRREAVVLSQMDSPHVVAVYDHGEQDGAPYLVTQLVRGGDLLALVRRRGALEPAHAVDLVAQVLRGLADAHAAGVVHRDVKPSNVLLSEDARVAYLCDFGIASSPGGDLTRTGALVGSTAYMAPERHAGETAGRAGVAADVYAAGCLLWQLVTGSQPYVGTEAEIVMGHLRGPVPQLPVPVEGAHGADVDGPAAADEAAFVVGLNAVVARALAKDPAQRYPTAKAMRHELLALADTAPGGLVLPDVTAVRQPLVLPDPLPTPVPAAPRPPWRRVAATAAVVALVASGVYVGSRLGGVPVGPTLTASEATPAADVPSPSPSAPGTPALPSASTAATPTPVPVPVPAPATEAAVPAPAPAPAAPAASPRPRRTATAKPTKAASAAPAPAPAPTKAAAPTPKFRCWDGGTAVKLSGCSLPTGRKGATWVFPGMASLSCSRINLSAPGFLEGWSCPGPNGNGKVAFVRWTGPNPGATYFWDGYEPGSRYRNDWTVGGTVYGRAQNGRVDGLFHSSRIYIGNGTNAWTFNAYAGRDTVRDDLMKITTFRAPDQFRGVPLS